VAADAAAAAAAAVAAAEAAAAVAARGLRRGADSSLSQLSISTANAEDFSRSCCRRARERGLGLRCQSWKVGRVVGGAGGGCGERGDGEGGSPSACAMIVVTVRSTCAVELVSYRTWLLGRRVDGMEDTQVGWQVESWSDS